MDQSEIPWVDAIKVRALPNHVLWVRFSDGCEGSLSLAGYLSRGGEMVHPLLDQAFFERVFIEEGVPMWPNHFDLDVANLYIEMRKAGTLRDRTVAAE